jgi:hypothetical protein
MLRTLACCTALALSMASAFAQTNVNGQSAVASGNVAAGHVLVAGTPSVGGPLLILDGGGSFGTAAFVATGTSGGTLGLLNANKTDSGNDTFSGTFTLSSSSNALGTPLTITLTNGTGLPIGGLTGLGAGAPTALANPTNAAGGLLTYGLIGTSGATIPLLSGSNTFGPQQTFSNGLTVPSYSITNPSGSQNTANVIYFSGTAINPQSEFRFNQIVGLTQLTSDSLNTPVLPWISQNGVDSGIYTFGGGGSGAGGEDSPGLYGYGRAQNSTTWVPGCTAGVPGTPGTCPGTTTWIAGVQGYADNAGTGELINAQSFLIHLPQALHSGGEIRNWRGVVDEGCSSGINASFCTMLDLGALAPEYSGFGTATPNAEVNARGNNTTTTANVYISGNTLCLASAPAQALIPFATVTGAGITSAHLLGTALSDVPNGHLCYTIDGSSQTVGSAGSPVAASFANNWVGFLSQQINATGEAGYSYQLGSGSVAASNARTVVRNDTTRPLGIYWALNVGGTDIAYATPSGSGRTAGLAVGYPNITTFPTLYSLTAGPSGFNSDGGYFAGGTAGVTCTSQNVSSVNGIVTACGGGRSPSTNIIQFSALAKANSAVVAAGNTGGTGYLVGDTITLTGGTCSVSPILAVATVSTTSVATVTVNTAGSCTALPDAPTQQGSTSGVGTGAAFQVTWGAIAQTYTPTAGISTVDVYLSGPGGSGGGGARQAVSTAVSGGGGGGGGSCNIVTLTPTQIGASQTVNIGLPGLQGAPATSNTTAGGNAGSGSTTTMGTLVAGLAGGGGGGGQLAATSGGGGGAAMTVGGTSTGITLGAGGLPGAGNGGTGAGGSTAVAPNAGGGGGGGASGGLSANGGSAGNAGPGGASGAGVTAANASGAGGTAGSTVAAGRTIAGPTGGAANTNGTTGTNQSAPQFCQFAGSGGSGGGSGLANASAGNGGDGALGAGAGGAGSVQNGTGVAGWGGLGGLGGGTLIEHF